jgi:hypothetical protein
MAARSRRARSATWTSGIGSCAMVSLWTGRNIQSESTSPRRVTPNKQGGGCGPAATSSRGYFEYAFGRAEVRPIARMTPTPILENGGDRPAQSLCEHRGSCRRAAACRSLLALANFRFGAHYGLKSDIASGPKCARPGNGVGRRGLRRKPKGKGTRRSQGEVHAPVSLLTPPLVLATPPALRPCRRRRRQSPRSIISIGWLQYAVMTPAVFEGHWDAFK